MAVPQARTPTPAATPSRTRVEHDLLGDAEVPADALWGVHTARALDNFPISGQPIANIVASCSSLCTSSS